MEFKCNYFSHNKQKIYWQVQAKITDAGVRIFTYDFENYEELGEEISGERFIRYIIIGRIWNLTELRE